jgi:hypothetical protein
VEASPGEQQVGYELTHYALRQAEFEELAQRQYAHYLGLHRELLAEAAESAGVRWTVPTVGVTSSLDRSHLTC